MFVTIQDSVYGFGENPCGKLGYGHQNNIIRACEIVELTNQPTTEFNNGENLEKVKSSGKIVELEKQGIIKFHIGANFVIASSINNKLFAWRINDRGKLGCPFENNVISKPCSIEFFDKVKIKQIDSYSNTIAIVTEDGKVYAWGDYFRKQSNVNNETVSPPVEIAFPNGVIIELIFVFKNSFAICNKGDVYIWGENEKLKPELSSKDYQRLSQSKKIESIRDVNHIGIIGLKTYFLTENKDTKDKKIFYSENFKFFHEVSYDQKYVIKRIITYNRHLDRESNSWFIADNEMVYKISSNGKALEKIEKNSIFDCYAEELKETVETIELKTMNDIGDIGHGAFGKVIKSIRYGRLYAIKKTNMDRLNRDIMDKNSEINIMWKLSSEYIANSYDYWTEKTKYNEFLFIQMEYCDCDLKVFLAKINEFRNNEIIFIIKNELLMQLFESVYFLHLNKVIHRDLKPSNILIKYNSPNGRFIKLCDFGLSINHDSSSNSHSSNVSSFRYMAPEVMKGRSYTEKADIYSLGEMITIDFYLFTTNERKLNEYLKEYSKEIETLVKLLTKNDPIERPTWNKILNNFITSNFERFLQISKCIISKFIEKESKNIAKEIINLLNILKKNY